jgi:hypothetical protein
MSMGVEIKNTDAFWAVEIVEYEVKLSAFGSPSGRVWSQAGWMNGLY